MNSELTQQQAMFKIVKVYIAQYLSSVRTIFPKIDGIHSYQNEALNNLTIFFIQTIKKLAGETVRLVRMQGRLEPNCLHLLFIAEKICTPDLEQLLQHVLKRKEEKINMASLAVVEKTAKKLFENDDTELAVNKYEKEKHYGNIRYIRPIYLHDSNKNALFFRAPIDEAFDLPPELSYSLTKENIKHEKKNVESLMTYTQRETRLSMLGLIKNERRERENDEEDKKVEKKRKFEVISYL